MNRRVQVHIALPGYAYDEIAINDLATAKFAGLALSSEPEVDITGHLVNRVTIQIPEAERRPSGGPSGGTSWLTNLVQQLIHDGSTDSGFNPQPVLGRVLRGGREVFLHDLVTRIAQRALKVVMEPHVERMLGPRIYSYRPGRSHLTALHHARCYLRRGYRWAAKADIAQFFPSISSTLMRRIVVDGCGWLAEDALLLILFFMNPLVLREPAHPAVVAGVSAEEEPPPCCVLQGSVLGPMLSNIVGQKLIDEPFAEVMGHRALLLRYADDMLILGREPGAVQDGLDLLHELVRPPFRLHASAAKTDVYPSDTDRRAVRWLGKDLVRGSVTTPEDDLREALGALRGRDLHHHQLKNRIQSAVSSLLLDPVIALERFATGIATLSPGHAWLLDDVRDWWPEFRTRQLRVSAALLRE